MSDKNEITVADIVTDANDEVTIEPRLAYAETADASAKRVKAQLVEVMVDTHVAFLDLPESLVLSVIDPQTLTLRNLPHGARYSLVPVDRDEPIVDALARVRHALDRLRAPCGLMSTFQARVDNVIECCAGLFNSVEYVEINTQEELEIMLNPRKNADHEFRKFKQDILGDLLQRVKERAKDSPTSGTFFDPDHVHTEECGHSHSEE